MRVFKIHSPESGMWLIGSGAAAARLIRLNGEPQAEVWPETAATLEISVGGVEAPQDIPWVGGDTIALPDLNSDFARTLKPFGEFLPVETPSRTYWLFNCTAVLSGALGPGSTGDWLDDERMIQLHRADFEPDVVRGYAAFRISEMRPTVFLTQLAERALRASHLMGLELREIWSET